MFDIGFWELALILVVALVVIGPDKLPGAARSIGLWVGRAKRIVNTVKNDIDKELRLQELQEQMKLDERNSLHQFVEETKATVDEVKQPFISLKDLDDKPASKD
ncbi:Sec-independent protein translocase protein TatB [Candidatus Albibeggiatoa sp. nov. NOAA]|uniref:Sec-independent protein translocase protein TatB n=1 Tax=Candidatus Albibeggiatoa sp. nov. NOAA TaxID=3162724 RepID=UPI003304FF26|nr:Sec-independent protein translocase protein TatB [Thiotrichaceae bacterium]